MPQIFGQMRLDATQHFGVNFRIAREGRKGTLPFTRSADTEIISD